LEEFFRWGAIVEKFDFTHWKVRKQPFHAKIVQENDKFQNSGGQGLLSEAYAPNQNTG